MQHTRILLLAFFCVTTQLLHTMDQKGGAAGLHWGSPAQIAAKLTDKQLQQYAQSNAHGPQFQAVCAAELATRRNRKNNDDRIENTD